MRRMRLPKASKAQRVDQALGDCVNTIPFKPFELNSTFGELGFNGVPTAYAPSLGYSGWAYTHSLCPANGDAAHEIEGDQLYIDQMQLRLCIDAGSGEYTGDPPVSHPAVCCRMLVIQLFGDEGYYQAGGIPLGAFFQDPNITSFMKADIKADNPSLAKFKVLVDKTFTTSEISAHTADRHVTWNYPLKGTVVTPTQIGPNPGDRNFAVTGPSRIIWGLFYEGVFGSSVFSASYPMQEIVPSYYGNLKIKWHKKST